MRLLAPFVQWSKADVYSLALRLDVPLGLTHSCEASDEPCGSCRSCVDREALLAS
jgi:7-cyano-7-deazaguanine synthase